MPDLERLDGRVSPAFVAAAFRARIRRWHAVRWFLAVVSAAALASFVDSARDNAAEAQAQWGAAAPVWVTTRSLEAGATLRPGDAAKREIPVLAVPDDAMRTDPTGLRLRVAVGVTEILRLPRLDPFGGGEVAARLPEQALAITLVVEDDIFTIDDRVDIYALSTGTPLSTDGTVVAVNEHRATVAIRRNQMSAVVAELSRGGVAVVLSR